MIKFLKYTFAALTGTVLGLFLFFILGVIIFAAVGAGSDNQTTEVAENSVLKLDLDQAISENASEENPFGDLGGPFATTNQTGVIQIKQALANAKADPNIKGIYLMSGMPQMGWAKAEEIRNALAEFKSSGKFIYAYHDFYSENGYYLASVADKVFLNPSGMVEFNGLSAEYEFFKGTLDKLNIKPLVFKVGTYKSAVEPFLLDKMSDASRQQTASFLNSMYDHALENISKSRKIGVPKLRAIADSLGTFEPQQALKSGLITDLGYYDEFEKSIKTKLTLKADDKIEFVSLEAYRKAPKMLKTGTGNDKVAVLVADGEITYGTDDDEQITETFAKNIKKAREDDAVKAIVLRINSPGGSALTSDILWREIQLAREKKPVIASMSDYAASGGYYLAMGCNKIVAQPTTLTGSIGIFGVLFRLDGFTKDKLGISFDRVNTNAHADWPTVTREMTSFENNVFQKSIEQGYATFTTKAAQGRKMPVEKLRELASGRVWTGKEAKANGLVDVLGGLDDAIKLAATEAKLKEGTYKVKYPTKKSFFENLMDKSQKDQDARLAETLGVLAPLAGQLKKFKQMEGIQARMPFEMKIQ